MSLTDKMKEFSNLAKIIHARTYARRDNGHLESWAETVDRVLGGNVRGHNLTAHEIERLKYFMTERKAGPAGRGWWASGSPAHAKVGGCAQVNCWFFSCDDWQNLVLAQDLLMLGGGVGMSVEHRFVSKLPRIKRDVRVVHQASKDADFIVPDSREGWNELTRRVLEAFFVTGKSFSYSTVCVRGAGEKLTNFGGISSGPLPLITCIEKLCTMFRAREGRAVRPLDAADALCAIGEMVVSGNIRRSATLIQGDCWDKDFLKVKRWDLGPLPSQRSCANYSVVCDDIEDLHPLFWKSYEHGEPIGLINRENMQKFARMGELKKDTAVGVNPCAEATLEDSEPCNLQEIALSNLTGIDEFIEACELMTRWGQRVTMEPYHQPRAQTVIKRNRRVGTGITGCLMSPLFTAEHLDRAYAALAAANRSYAAQLGINESIRLSVVKPSGTSSKLYDMHGYEGVHAAFSRYMIQRVRFAANDPLVPLLKAAGHRMEPVARFDGTLDLNTLVVDFYQRAPDGYPVADEDWDTWKQLDVVKLAQAHWADQSVSVTVYYKKEEIQQLKEWLAQNYCYLKTISFLCHSDHGFLQAPKEAISEQQYEALAAKVKPIDIDALDNADDGPLDGLECEGGACPIR